MAIIQNIKHHSNDNAVSYLIKNVEPTQPLLTKKDQLRFWKQLQRPSAVSLRKSLFLRYNTRAIKFLIIDCDHIHYRVFLERHSDKLMNLPPTWITATNNGVQLAYALRDSLPLKSMNKRSRKFLNDVKKALIDAFDADQNGTTRNTGIWRNPITHESTINPGLEYSLSDIADAFDIKPVKRSQKLVTPLNSNISKVDTGGRNNALYWRCVTQINQTPDVSENDMGDWAVLINAEQVNPLSEAEAHKTGRSAWRQYHEMGKRLRFVPAFDYKKWKREYNRKYWKENGDSEMTRSENAKKQATELAERKRAHVRSVVQTFVNLNQKITAVAVSQAAKVSRNTATKYLKEMKSEGLL